MIYLKKSKQSLSAKIAKIAIFFYQGIFPSQNRLCRFDPTCSQYLVQAIEKYGPARGAYLFIKRIASCHPFSSKNQFDNIPQ